MKTKSKRLLSSILATMLLGQNLLCNNALITNLKVDATSTDKETLVQEIEERAESLKYSGSRSSGISLFSLFSTKKSNSADSLNVSGYVSLEDGRTSDVAILIFDDNWNTLAQTTADNNGYFSVSALNIKGRTSTTHVKIECNGYLPRFYKDMGFGSYQFGTENNPEVLYFGDTTYNPDANHQWSDEFINENDLTFVEWQRDKRKPDEDYDEKYDLDDNGVIDSNDKAILVDLYGHWFTEDNLIIDSDGLQVIGGEFIFDLDFNGDNVIDEHDSDFYNAHPNAVYKGDEDFEQIAYIDINENGIIDDTDYNAFSAAIQNHNGHNPYNDYIYNITLTGNCYHEGAMYLENTNLDLANYNLVVNGNFVFRTQNPYNSVLWGDNPCVTLNVGSGALSIAGQFDFGQANSYDQIIMQEDAGELYIWENWNYITLADMEGKWIAGRIGLFGNTWQVNEQSGEKAVFSSGTHSILFGGYEYGQQVIRWDNRYDTIYNEFTGERNTPRQLNLDYTQGDLCLGVLLSKEYTSENYYFRPSLPDLVTLYQDADNNGINDSIDEVYGGDEVNEEKLEENEDIVQKWINKRIIETPEDEVIEELYSEDNPYKKDNLKALGKYLYDKARAEIEGVENFATKTYGKVRETLLTLSDEIPDCVKLGYDGFRFAISLSPDPICQSLDFVLSVADVGYDLLTFECTTEWFADFGLDVIGVIPFIGAAKEFAKTGKAAKEVSNLKEIKKVDGLLNYSTRKGITETAKELVEKYGKKALNQLGEEIKKEVTKKFFEKVDEFLPKINELLSDEELIDELNNSNKQHNDSEFQNENATTTEPIQTTNHEFQTTIKETTATNETDKETTTTTFTETTTETTTTTDLESETTTTTNAVPTPSNSTESTDDSKFEELDAIINNIAEFENLTEEEKKFVHYLVEQLPKENGNNLFKIIHQQGVSSLERIYANHGIDEIKHLTSKENTTAIEQEENFARETLGIKTVSFQGLDSKVAKEINQTLEQSFEKFPELKNYINFVGTLQARNKKIKEISTDYYSEVFEFQKDWINSYVDLALDKVKYDDNTLGQYYPANLPYLESMKGIAINGVFSYSDLLVKLNESVNSNSRPQECDTIKGLIDHETGHALDDMLKISDELDYLLDSQTKPQIKSEISNYATKDVKELVAEAWSKYNNSSNPGGIATYIANEIEKKYEEHYG